MMMMSEFMGEYYGIDGMITKEVLDSIGKTFYDYKFSSSIMMVYS